MAATVTITNRKTVAVGDRLHARCTVTEAGTYAAGGTVITAKQLGLTYIEAAFPVKPNTIALDVSWDQVPGTTIKIETFKEDTISGIEAEITGNVTTVYSLLVVGI
jgi:hypothetical protein